MAHYKKIVSTTLLLVGFLLGSALSWAQAPNPKTNYMLDGQAVSPWNLVVGDEKNWYQVITEDSYQSVNKAIRYTKKIDEGKTASYFVWRSAKKDAAVTLAGQPIDLSTLPDTIGIAIEMKMHSKLRNNLALSMDCDYPCRGTVNLKPILEAYEVGEWFTLPIPLRCFSQAGTDLTKVNGPLHLQTKGKFKMSLGSVRLVQLPADIPLCK